MTSGGDNEASSEGQWQGIPAMSDNGHTTPQDDGQPPALPAPGGRVTRSYAPAERMAIMMRALRDGVSATARRHDVPRSTVVGWFSDYGGIEEVRERLMAESFSDFVRAEQSVYDAVAKRADELPADELMMTFRKLVEARLIPTLTGSDTEGGNGQPVAAAQAKVTLKVIEKDGEVTVIDLGAPPEELS